VVAFTKFLFLNKTNNKETANPTELTTMKAKLYFSTKFNT